MFKIGNNDIEYLKYKKTIVYFLKRTSHLDFNSNINIDNSEWFIGVVKGSKAIYASTKNNLNTTDTYYSHSYLAVQRFLDMAILIEKPAMALENDKDKQVSLFISNDHNKSILSIFAKDFQKFEMSLMLEVRDLEGNLVPQKFPLNEYKPSVRYFRMSQLSESLLDAYRYLYLSVESALNDFCLKIKKDKEIEWICKAVNLANSKSKSPLSYKQYSTIGDYFIDYHYKKFRLKLFHSKEEILLPLDHYDLTSIYNAYIDLFDFCAMIYEVQYGFNIKGGSHFTEHAIKAAIEGLRVNEIEFFKNNEPTQKFFKIDTINQFAATGYNGHLKFELDITTKQKISFDKYEISLDKIVYISLDLEEKIELEGFDCLFINHEVMFTNKNLIDRPFLL